MSVRPLSVGELYYSQGGPLPKILGFFGATQGMLVYLHRHRIPFNQNWFGAPGSPGKFLLFVVGGTVGGYLLGYQLFKDPELIRLSIRHQRDQRLEIEGQRMPLR